MTRAVERSRDLGGFYPPPRFFRERRCRFPGYSPGEKRKTGALSPLPGERVPDVGGRVRGHCPLNSRRGTAIQTTPSPVPRRLMKAPPAVYPLPWERAERGQLASPAGKKLFRGQRCRFSCAFTSPRQKEKSRRGGTLRVSLRYSCYYWLLRAESHLTRRLFGAMLRRIELLPVPTG